MLPTNLIDEFWTSVRQQLVHQFQIAELVAEQGISDFQRDWLPRIGETIYRHDAEEIATRLAERSAKGVFRSLP